MNHIVVFTDGSSKDVSYGQAATIYQILLGNKEPDSDEQRKFMEKVATVVFPPMKEGGTPQTPVKDPERKRKIDAILDDYSLPAKEKARKIAKLLGGRSE